MIDITIRDLGRKVVCDVCEKILYPDSQAYTLWFKGSIITVCPECGEMIHKGFDSANKTYIDKIRKEVENE